MFEEIKIEGTIVKLDDKKISDNEFDVLISELLDCIEKCGYVFSGGFSPRIKN